MKSVECPKCKSENTKPFSSFNHNHICIACGHRFEKCPKCDSCDIEPVPSFDYVKECKDCFHEFSTGEHN